MATEVLLKEGIIPRSRKFTQKLDVEMGLEDRAGRTGDQEKTQVGGEKNQMVGGKDQGQEGRNQGQAGAETKVGVDREAGERKEGKRKLAAAGEGRGVGRRRG